MSNIEVENRTETDIQTKSKTLAEHENNNNTTKDVEDKVNDTFELAFDSPTPTHTVIVPFLTVEQFKKGALEKFDEIIDVRTPLEFQEDRICNAINLPVLSNEQRVEVGTLYHKDRMAARKLGAALISGNISRHILEHFTNKPGNYRPLIYCWRGGQRSRSLALILREICFPAYVFQGGYKEYRKIVREEVQDSQVRNNIDDFKFILMSGTTGNGKSLLLETLRERGEQMLHLEYLARHKGSVLGNYPGEPQPNQKYFETQIFQALYFDMDPKRVVWVEYESFKIGNITVPKKISNKMIESPRIHIEVDMEDRVKFILHDYDYICKDKINLLSVLKRLERTAGKQKCEEWSQMVEGDKFEELVRNLIIDYYDKCYRLPRGEALKVFKIPTGLILDKEKLLNSETISEMVKLGADYIEKQDSINTNICSCD